MKESKKDKSFIKKRMHNFKEGEMHSRVKKTGPVVTNPKQAIAIALSEAREKGMKVGRKKPKE
jgi:flagellar biosynthesis protein FlhB